MPRGAGGFGRTHGVAVLVGVLVPGGRPKQRQGRTFDRDTGWKQGRGVFSLCSRQASVRKRGGG